MEQSELNLFMASISHGIPVDNDVGFGEPFLENYDDDAINVFDDFMLFDDHHHLDRLSLLGEGAPVAFDHRGGGGDDQQGPHRHCLLPVSGRDEYAAAAAAAAEGGDGGDSNCDLAAGKGARRDRSKTLVSERKRRVRMKERLYELRSLVPTISKMDKASIIADAVAYVKDLQSQAKKLEEEINLLEKNSSSPANGDGPAPQIPGRKSNEGTATRRLAAEIEEEPTEAEKKKKKTTTTESSRPPVIMQVSAYDVGAGKLYVKVAGSTGDGTSPSAAAAASSSLYSAVESLIPCFELESSNFVLDGGEGFVFTVTFVSKAGEMCSANTMELWMMSALLKQGFQLLQTAFN